MKGLKSKLKLNNYDIDEIIDGMSTPYVKRGGNGMYDVFDGQFHFYCGTEFKEKYEAELNKMYNNVHSTGK